MAEESKSNRCVVCGAPSEGRRVCRRCASRSGRSSGTPPPASGRPTGIILEGKYRLRDELGRGGMGTVFKAVDESLDRLVAVKFLLPEHMADPGLVARFKKEAQAMASVRHENVLQIYSFGTHGKTSFFVMEYIEGKTADELLEAALGRREMLPLMEVIRILDQTAAGLAAVHQAGVVHRDIKPGNLMVHDDSKRVVIMDFGIGRRYQPGDSRRTMAPGGTPAYMAPELITGKQISPTEDFLSDIYAYGVTAYELLTGQLPFQGENWVQTFQRHLTEYPPSAAEIRPGVPKLLDGVVFRCLAKAPEDRFQSFAAIREALQPLVVEEAGRPTPTPAPVEAPPRPQKQQPSSSRVTRQARIVVADTDPGFRTMVYQCAEDVLPGCRFKAARTALTALDIARKAPPLVLVAPLRDRGLNGLELLAAVSGDSDLEGVKVVLSTDEIADDERTMLEMMGAFDVVRTPAVPEQIRALLRRAAAMADSAERSRMG